MGFGLHLFDPDVSAKRLTRHLPFGSFFAERRSKRWRWKEMRIDIGEMSRLVGLFYEGFADANLWRDFFQETSRHLECDKATLIFRDAKNQAPALGMSFGISDEAARSFRE
jgi:hypothetical protein